MMVYRKILVNALCNLGDVILSTSAVALIKKLDPSVKITMLVRPFAREVVENNPVVDDVISFGYKAKKKSWREMWQMVQKIKRENFDLCISLDRKLRPALLTWLARIPTRVVPERIFDDKSSRVTMFYTDVTPMNPNFENIPQADNFQSVIREFFHTNLKAKPVIGIPREDNIRKAEDLLNTLPKSKLKIALCVKGSFPLKDWPPEYFVRLIQMLDQKYDSSFFIIGAPGDRDYAEKIVQSSAIPIQNFCGKTSIMDLVPIFEQTDLFVTVDTGALHVAATTSVPIVAMYGCGPSTRWPPLTENSRIVCAHVDCSPCHVAADACPALPKPKCQWQMTPDMVFDACEQLLNPN
ncbi:MAG: glycosyltransferase family 9 protein [Selenomonadaceae bacterium]|nr:glycosyltransferase family 9 protein [Selenomonadaceae bacterium]